MDKLNFYYELIIFLGLVTLYFFIATRKSETKWTKIGEVATVYLTILFFQVSKTISTVLFIVAALGIILFNIKKAKSDERRSKRVGS